MIIQWIAAAMAQKKLVYYCEGDENLAQDLTSVVQKYGSKSAG
jgi:Poly (ADP-ribose) glycohydrolase (PARG)